MGLASRWAVEEDLVKEALKQDSRVKKQSDTPKKATALPSKWADAHHVPQGPRKSAPKSTATELEAKNHKDPARRGRRKSDHRVQHKQNELVDRHSLKEPVKDLAQDLGARLDIRENKHKDHPSPKHRDSPRHKEGAKHKEGPKHGIKHKEGPMHKDDTSDSHLPHEILHEKGPMTDAARSLASRIGTAGAVSAPGEQKKYMTPIQKREARLREEREKKAEKLKKEQELKDARLQQEVRDLFEKMSDKSKSWADIEDED